jgi:hypothetical protein
MYLAQILNQIHQISLTHFCLYFVTDGVCCMHIFSFQSHNLCFINYDINLIEKYYTNFINCKNNVSSLYNYMNELLKKLKFYDYRYMTTQVNFIRMNLVYCLNINI